MRCRNPRRSHEGTFVHWSLVTKGARPKAEGSGFKTLYRNPIPGDRIYFAPEPTMFGMVRSLIRLGVGDDSASAVSSRREPMSLAPPSRMNPLRGPMNRPRGDSLSVSRVTQARFWSKTHGRRHRTCELPVPARIGTRLRGGACRVPRPCLCRQRPAPRHIETLLAAHDEASRVPDPIATAVSESASQETLPGTVDSAMETVQVSPIPHPRRSSQRTNSRQNTGRMPRSSKWRPPRWLRAPAGPSLGQVIAGRYTLREVLGEGGMGAVYRADQTEPVRRQVALKLIKIGMDSRAVLARFDAERQALALMDHPSIARVYDGGTTLGGQPFFVMELVHGEPINQYCDRKRLPVRARLELFVTTCQAVQHAHQKGIIHRDLKPSNILVAEVDGRPTPKVIDFGVAKATEFQLTEQSLADAGAIVGTPAYMSPEQADPSSMDIDTRTDVYALGVVLYELLAGSPPIDANQFKRGAVLEMLRMVREVDPPRPSTKVSTAVTLPSIAASRNIEPAHLKQALQGDLDWIVMKALEKDRSRRYETASGFAADVLRHLGARASLGRTAQPGLPNPEVREEAPRRGGRRQSGRPGTAGRHGGDNLGVDP